MTRKRRLFLLLFLPLFAAGLAAFYLFISGTFFLRGFFLPFVSRRAGVEIQTGHAEWGFFGSRVRLRSVQVALPGKTPFFTADAVLFDYSLYGLLRGNLQGSALAAERPRFEFFRDAAGNWNTVPSTPSHGSVSGIFLDIRNVRLRDAALHVSLTEKSGEIARFRLHSAEFSADRLTNHAPVNITLTSKFALEAGRDIRVEGADLTAAYKGNLNAFLIPADGRLAIDLGGLSGAINAVKLGPEHRLALSVDGRFDAHRAELRKLQLRQYQNQTAMTRLDASGIFHPAPLELRGDIDVALGGGAIPAVLCGFLRDFNPGNITGNYAGNLDYRAGVRLNLRGEGALRREGNAVFGSSLFTLPPFDVRMAHDFAFDLAAGSADMKLLEMRLESEGREQAALTLSRPVRYSWKDGAAGPDLPNVHMSVHGLDLRLLNFLPAAQHRPWIAAGALDAEVNFALPGTLRGTGHASGVRLASGDMGKTLDGEVDFSATRNAAQEILWGLKGRARAAGEDLVNFSLTGTHHPAEKNTDFELRLCDLSAALLEFLPQDRAEPYLFLRELRPLAGQLDMTGGRSGGVFDIRRLDLQLDGRDRSRLRCEFEPFRWNTELRAAPRRLEAILRGEFPGALLAAAFPLSPIQMPSGQVRLETRLHIQPNLSSAGFDGRVDVEQAEFNGLGWNFRNIGVRCDFDAQMPDQDTLQLRNFNLYALAEGKPALRLELPGRYSLADGSFNGEVSLRYLNENFFNLIRPGLLTDAQIHGRAEVRYNGKERLGTCSGGVVIDRVSLPQFSVPFSGGMELQFDSSDRGYAIRRIDGRINTAETPIAAWNGSIDWPLVSTGEPVRISLRIPTLNLGPYPATEEAPPFVLPEPSPGAAFHFNRKYEIQFQVERLLRDNFNDTGITGNATLDKNEIAVDPLRFHLLSGGLFEGATHCSAEESGAIRFRSRGVATEDLPLKTLNRWFGSADSDFVRGYAENLHWDITGKFQAEKTLELAGTMTGTFSALEFTNGYAATPMGKLIFLPLEVMVRLRDILPDRMLNPQNYADAFIRLGDTKGQFNALRFAAGKLKIRFQEGDLLLEECRLERGSPVGSMDFTGRLPLYDAEEGAREGEVRELKLLSNLGGVILPITVRGSFESPQVNLRRIGSDLLSANARNMVAQLGGLTGRLLESAPETETPSPMPLQAEPPPKSGGLFRKIFFFWK